LALLLEHTLFDGGVQLAVTLVVLFASQVVYALFGFGSGLLSVAVLAFFYTDLSGLVALLLLINLPTELFVVRRDRRSVPWRELGPLLLALAAGIPLGTALLRAGAGERWLVLLLGALLLVFAGWFLFMERPRPAHSLPAGSSLAAGLVSGVLAGLFGTGGPPLILHFRLRGLEKQAFRAALLAVFLVTGLVRFPVYIAAGLVRLETLWSALLVLPACLLGLAVGQRLHVGISEEAFRQATAAALGLLGVLLLATG
jgi:uncharacterized membrane protein YfcA